MIDETKLKEMPREEALKLYIPKWPQCIITGNKITPEQADEIIRRTDNYFMYPHCNDRDFDKKFNEISKGILNSNYLNELEGDEWQKEYEKYREIEKRFFDAWGYLEKLNYLDNDFIASSYCEGANGWCHPDGTIAHYDNIGKWPKIDEVENDLRLITETFPYLRLECTLCYKEWCESDNKSIVTIIAEKGNVKFYEPVPYDDLEKICKRYPINNDCWVSHCFDIDHIKEWFDRIDLDKIIKGEE